ncbi:DUF6059 family protein [Streptomyces sp. NPDC020141]|uniref:DUF6059 family protein n=1 Tax=Streptomyces sp. NPDC020141 TaxID=3365065 RepID=UPI0037ACF440
MATSSGWPSLRRTAHRIGMSLVRGLASQAAVFGVLPADAHREASRGWLAPGASPSARPPGGRPDAPASHPNAPYPNDSHPYDSSPYGDAPAPRPDRPGAPAPRLDEPPAGHPERLSRGVPLSPCERELWAQLEGPDLAR